MRPRTAAVIALAVLAVIHAMVSDDSRELSSTSFGKVPSGHGALFELWIEIGIPVTRSYAPPERLPSDASVWWIEPRDLCDVPPGSGAGESVEDGESEPSSPVASETHGLARFVEAGGTAVVLLAAQPADLGESPAPCIGLAGVALPGRELSLVSVSEEPAEPEAGLLAEEAPRRAASRRQTIEGDLVADPRVLIGPGLVPFEDSRGWLVRARLDGEPFVLEHVLGRGRIVAVSDASFVQNAWLDGGDAAPLAIDLVRAYDIASIDEYQHGLRQAASGTLSFLARSPASPVLLGLAVLGLLVLWYGTALPRAAELSPPLGSPTLEEYVGSLATLYAGSRDHARLAERYRELTLARIRRHFGLPVDSRPEALLARIRRSGRLDAVQLRDLEEPVSAARQSEVHGWMRRFDAALREVCR